MRKRDFRYSRRRDFDADMYHPQQRAFGTRLRYTQPRFEAPSGPPVRGTVKWFNPEKGFGFVKLSDGSGDAFLHGSVLAQSGTAAVQPGETLEVRVGPGHKAPHITEVLSVDSRTAAPSTPRQRTFAVTQRNGLDASTAVIIDLVHEVPEAAKHRKFADSPLEGTGFEISVPRYP